MQFLYIFILPIEPGESWKVSKRLLTNVLAAVTLIKNIFIFFYFYFLLHCNDNFFLKPNLVPVTGCQYLTEKIKSTSHNPVNQYVILKTCKFRSFGASLTGTEFFYILFIGAVWESVHPMNVGFHYRKSCHQL